MQRLLTPGQHRAPAPALDVSVAVANDGVELLVVAETRVVSEDCPGRAVAPASVNLRGEGGWTIMMLHPHLSRAPEVFLPALLTIILTFLYFMKVFKGLRLGLGLTFP